MKVPVLIYEGFAEFEMTLLGFIARQEKNVISTVARTTPRVTGAGGLTVRAGPTLSQVNPDEYNALVVPGGQRDGLLDRDEVCGLIRRFNDSGSALQRFAVHRCNLRERGCLLDHVTPPA